MELRDLAPVGVLFVLIAITLSVGGEILSNLEQQQCAKWNATTNTCESTTTAYNMTTQGTSGITKIAKWLPTIALVIAAAVVIGVVLTSFILRRK